MNKKSKVYIELTAKQRHALMPLFEKVAIAHSKEKPIMLLSQIMMTDSGEVVAICNVTTHEEGIELQKVLGSKKIGGQVGNDYFEKALAKARL
jgi:hypothetical protein